jgi:hypothetical protein
MIRIHMVGGLQVTTDVDFNKMDDLMGEAIAAKVNRITINARSSRETIFLAHVVAIEEL